MFSRNWKKSFDFCLSCILLTTASISVYLTVRVIGDSLTLQPTGRSRQQPKKPFRVYTFLVQFFCAVVSLLSGLIGLIASLNPYLNRCVLLTGLLFSVMSTFGALMTGAVTIFQVDWKDHVVAVQKVIRLCLCGFLFIVSTYLAVVLTRKFRATDSFDYHFPPPSQRNPLGGSGTSSAGDMAEALLVSVPVLSSLLIISGGTGMLGFAMGAATFDRHGKEVILAGGIHSGFCAMVTGVLAVLTIYVFHRRHRHLLVASITLCVITLFASAVAFYTEEVELRRHIDLYARKETSDSRSVHHLLLAKATLVLFSALFNILFVVPLLGCLICQLPAALSHRFQHYQSSAAYNEYASTSGSITGAVGNTGAALAVAGPGSPRVYITSEYQEPVLGTQPQFSYAYNGGLYTLTSNSTM